MKVSQASVYTVILFSTLTLIAGFSRADNLLQNGDVEDPKVEGRSTVEDGGDPSNLGAGPGWTSAKSLGQERGVAIGLTDKIAQSGRQSLFVGFDNFPGGEYGAKLVTELMPVTAGQTLRISFWNRLDPETPLKASGNAIVKIFIDFFKTEFGDESIKSEYPYAPLSPGRGNEGLNSETWTQVERSIKVPPEAVSVRVSFLWQSGGPVQGVIYYDEFKVESVGP